MIAFNDVIPVLNLLVLKVRRAPTFAFEQGKRTAIGGRLIRVDKSRDPALLNVVEDFTKEPLCSFAVTAWREVKIDGGPSVVDGPVKISPPTIHLHVHFVNVPWVQIGKVTAVPAQAVFQF